MTRTSTIRGPMLLAAAIAAGVVAWQSPVALVIWALDGILALLIVGMAAAAGVGCIALFRLGPLTIEWRVILGAGLGLGFVSLLTLGLGVVGLIGPQYRWVAPAVLMAAALGGLLHVWKRPSLPSAVSPMGRPTWILACIAPFVALVVLVAVCPPGLLWVEEGRGYDVLEYHLQLPREYYDDGRISYLPHNVYANMPSAAEMLYLFCNQVTDQPVEGWPVAKCVNALMGLLFAAAAWLAGRTISDRAGLIGGVLAASCGWIVYLSGVAYVENGMLLCGMLALACILRANAAATSQNGRWIALAGVLVGLACGFKYTAAPMIALPAACSLAVLSRESAGRRVRMILLFAATTTAAFSPWLIKNVVMTGNPVFPLANSVFKAYPPGWGPEESDHFADCHAPAGDEAGPGGRLRVAWRHILADPDQRLGAPLFILAAIAIARHRSQLELALLIMLAAQFAVWLFATHLFARFAVPMMLPLVLLAARGATGREGSLRRPFVGLVLIGVAVNLLFTARLYHRHVYVEGQRLNLEGGSAAFTTGVVPGYEYLEVLNEKLPADSCVLLVGDSRPFYVLRPVDYCVVFNRNPFAEVVSQSNRPEEALQWLRDQHYTHVLVHWDEIHRLRRSRYGFPSQITPELFEQLESAGLTPVERARYGMNGSIYAVLYRVAP